MEARTRWVRSLPRAHCSRVHLRRAVWLAGWLAGWRSLIDRPTDAPLLFHPATRQGIHNALLHPYPAVSSSSVDRVFGGIARLSAQLRSNVTLRYAHAEDAFIATVQYLVGSRPIVVDSDGLMRSVSAPDVPAAMVHQYNRDAKLEAALGVVFDDAALVKRERAAEAAAAKKPAR